MIDETTALHMADLFAALADPNRLRIVAALSSGEKNVSELAEAIGSSESAISHQMRILRQLRLVRTRKEGRFVFYELDDDHVLQLFKQGMEHVTHG